MKNNMQRVSVLFPRFQPELINEMSEKGEIREFKAGDTIMRTGQNIRFTILVISGLIKVYREDDEGNEYFMYYLQPGEACAVSLICATKRETSQVQAKAVVDIEVIAIPIASMDEWMQRYKSWYYFVLETYRSRFDELLQTIDHIAFRNMDERLVFYLRRHQENLHTNRVDTSFTQIAQELNSSREVVSRLMKKLADKGLIKLHRSYVEILNLSLQDPEE
ncbi:MAG: Crp/Fnr family transcriptional regulator [Agriterribacter sp.]